MLTDRGESLGLALVYLAWASTILIALATIFNLVTWPWYSAFAPIALVYALGLLLKALAKILEALS